MLKGRADELKVQLEKALTECGVPFVLNQVGPLLGLFFSDELVVNYEGAKKSADTGLYKKVFHEMLKRSIALPPSPYEVFFPSLAHTWPDIERTGDTFMAALAAALETK
jgi:glutamate-1-semialdehyde 2,1-aminomutase